MPIKTTSFSNAISRRAHSYYYASRLIIEYQGGDDLYKMVSFSAVNNIFLDFLNGKDKNEEELESYIVQLIAVLQYYHNAAFLQSKSAAEIQKELGHAEHLYNWLFREESSIEPVVSIIEKKDIRARENIKDSNVLQIVEHTPLSTFNKATVTEWLKILNKPEKQPLWYLSLSEWEKNILYAFVEAWNERDKISESNHNKWPISFKTLPIHVQKKILRKIKIFRSNKVLHKLNLGDFLGVQKGYIPNYPSIRNGYRVSICSYARCETEKIRLIKKSSVIRAATPFVNLDTKDRGKIVINNIKQTILFDLVNPLKRIARLNSRKSVVKIPILLQNLIAHHRVIDDEEVVDVVKEAVEKLKLEFESKEETKKFLEENTEQLIRMIKRDTLVTDPKKFMEDIIKNNRLRFSIAMISHNVIDMSLVEKFRLPFSREKSERDEIISILDAEYVNLMKKGLMIDGKPLIRSQFYGGKVKKLLEAKDPVVAMQKLCAMIPEDSQLVHKTPMLKIGLDAYDRFLDDESNSLEAAAYLQIAFSSVGIRVGGCANGCDLESPLILMVNALRMFYTRFGYFPGAVRVSDEEEHIQKDILTTDLAHEFLQGYCHNLLDLSSEGCSGVLYLNNTFGAQVLEKLKMLAPEYGIDVEKYDFYECAMRLSKTEASSEIIDLDEYKDLIDKTVSDTTSLQNNNSWDKEKSFPRYARIELPVPIVDAPESEENANMNLQRKLTEKLHNIFGIESLKELKRKAINESKKSPSISSSLHRLNKFHQNIRD